MQIKTDRETYLPSPIINPNSLGPVGWWFIDGLSGVKITRLTDERDGAGFGTSYSIWPTANCDNTRLWIHGVSGYWTAEFDPVSGSRVGKLSAVPPLSAQHFANHESALWSNEPDKVFIFADAKLYTFQPSTGMYKVLRDLTSALGTDYYVTQQFKSADDKRFAGAGPLGFMVYDIEQDRVLLDVRTTDMNGIALDRTGKWVLYVPTDDNTEYLYNVETGAKERITSDPQTGKPDFTIGHCDVGSDMIAGNDEWRGGITARKFSSPHSITLPFVYAPHWINLHLSMTADDDQWALLSTYGDVVGGLADPNKFKDECFQIGIQGEAAGKIRRLFHHRARTADLDFEHRYWAVPKGTLSKDGRFVFFTSNMGATRNDLYVADLGATDSTPAPLPPLPEPAPQPTPAPAPTPAPMPDPPIPQPPTGSTPSVALVSPANGAVLSGKVTVTATVTEATEAYLVVDDIVHGAVFKPPYEFVLDTTKLPEGNHSLYVRAWNGGNAKDSQKITVTVKNAVVEPPVPQPEPPAPLPPPKPTITAPASIDIPRNGFRDISVRVDGLTEAATVTVSGWDGQVAVTPTTKTVLPTSAILSFRIKVKNKKLTRLLTFKCPSAEDAVVRVNVV